MAHVVSNADAVAKIQNEESFRNKTTPDDDGIPAWWAKSHGATVVGYLPAEYHADARAARYVVYSYSTPIAWVRQDGAHVIPDVGYSPTTGQHQMATQHAWDMRVYPAHGRLVVRPVATHTQYGRGRRLRRGGMDGWSDGVLTMSDDAMHWSPS